MKTIQESQFCQVDKNKYSESSHRELGARKQHRALLHNGVHDRIHLDHAEIYQLQRQEGIRYGKEHCSGCQEEQPGMMPVQKNHIIVGHTSMDVSSGPYKAEKDGSPRKISPFIFCTFVACNSACFHLVLLPFPYYSVMLIDVTSSK